MRRSHGFIFLTITFLMGLPILNASSQDDDGITAGVNTTLPPSTESLSLDEIVFSQSPITDLIFESLTSFERQQARLVSKIWKRGIEIANKVSGTLRIRGSDLRNTLFMPASKYAHLVIEPSILTRDHISPVNWQKGLKSLEARVLDFPALAVLLHTTSASTALKVEIATPIQETNMNEWLTVTSPNPSALLTVHAHRTVRDLTSLAVTVETVPLALTWLTEIDAQLDVNNLKKAPPSLENITLFIPQYTKDFMPAANGDQPIVPLPAHVTPEVLKNLLDLAKKIGPRLHIYTLNDLLQGMAAPIHYSPFEGSIAGLLPDMLRFVQGYGHPTLRLDAFNLFMQSGFRPSTLKSALAYANVPCRSVFDMNMLALTAILPPSYRQSMYENFPAVFTPATSEEEYVRKENLLMIAALIPPCHHKAVAPYLDFLPVRNEDNQGTIGLHEAIRQIPSQERADVIQYTASFFSLPMTYPQRIKIIGAIASVPSIDRKAFSDMVQRVLAQEIRPQLLARYGQNFEPQATPLFLVPVLPALAFAPADAREDILKRAIFYFDTVSSPEGPKMPFVVSLLGSFPTDKRAEIDTFARKGFQPHAIASFQDPFVQPFQHSTRLNAVDRLAVAAEVPTAQIEEVANIIYALKKDRTHFADPTAVRFLARLLVNQSSGHGRDTLVNQLKELFWCFKNRQDHDILKCLVALPIDHQAKVVKALSEIYGFETSSLEYTLNSRHTSKYQFSLLMWAVACYTLEELDSAVLFIGSYVASVSRMEYPKNIQDDKSLTGIYGKIFTSLRTVPRGKWSEIFCTLHKKVKDKPRRKEDLPKLFDRVAKPYMSLSAQE